MYATNCHILYALCVSELYMLILDCALSLTFRYSINSLLGQKVRKMDLIKMWHLLPHPVSIILEPSNHSGVFC